MTTGPNRQFHPGLRRHNRFHHRLRDRPHQHRFRRRLQRRHLPQRHLAVRIIRYHRVLPPLPALHRRDQTPPHSHPCPRVRAEHPGLGAFPPPRDGWDSGERVRGVFRDHHFRLLVLPGSDVGDA